MSDKNVLIQVKDLKKAFGTNQVLDGITTDICQGEVVAVIGPSGSGKSTFLRSLNLLEVPTGGQILFEGTDITDPKVDINRHRQKIGMVFQQFNLFPHKTVKQNIMLAPVELKLMTKDEASKKADELLVLFHSDGLAVHGKCRHSVSLLCARPGLSLVFAEIIARERRKNKVRTAAFCPRRDSISRISDKKKGAAQGGSFKQKLSYVSSTGSMICSRNWPCWAENTHSPPLRWAMAWMLRHP